VINEEIKLPQELLAPQLNMTSIVLSNKDNDIKDNEDGTNYSVEKHYYPSVIIDDWLFLGSAYEARDKYILKKIGITHILNVTNDVNCFFINDEEFIYAQIPLNDVGNDAIYNYFEATKEFINECNPLYSKNSNKVFVHCAVGMSRSATIVIAYLMSSYIELNENDLKRLEFIRNKLETMEHGFSDRMEEFMRVSPLFRKYKDIENELDETQNEMLKKYRSQYTNDENMSNERMKLNEAYYYVKSCRSIISPNIGFCAQLERFEKLYNNGETTLCDLEKFTLIDNMHSVEAIWKEAADKYPNAQCVDNDNRTKLKFCALL